MTEPDDPYIEYDDTNDASQDLADPDQLMDDPGRMVYDKAALDAIRASAAYKKLRGEFRDQCAKMSVPLSDGTMSKGAPCWLDGRAIDYRLRSPHPESWSLDHAKTVKEAPELIMDVANWRPSHLDCNLRRGTDEPFIDIGVPSRMW